MAITLEKQTERPTREFHILKEPDWRSAAWAGVIGAVVSLALQMALTAISGGSAWAPLRMMSSLIMNTGQLPFAGVNSAVVLGGVLLSLTLGVAYAAVLSDFVSYQKRNTAIAMGLAFGLVLYWINFYGLASTFPSVIQYRHGITWVSHIVSGGVVAWTYKMIEPVFDPRAARKPEMRTPAEA